MVLIMHDPGRRRIRSQLNRQILATLATRVAAPILAAELYRLLSISGIRTTGDVIRVLEGRQYFYVYLHRLAEKGLVRMEGIRRRKRLYLTPKGVRALRDLEKDSALAKRPEGREVEGKLRSLGRKAARLTPGDRFHEIRKTLARVLGPSGTDAVFISYDIPEACRSDRIRLGRRLRELDFLQVNGSFYVGPRRRLKSALSAMEDLELLPYGCWGTLRLLEP